MYGRSATRYADDRTGLHYNTFRFSDPDVGRFINQDPVGVLSSRNRYAYALNPVSWSDPWGWCNVQVDSKKFDYLFG
ncbi:TPA: RHS repeat-associated core domain-containing protein [Burkholderia lata]|uniref:RHS repeat-associated core domain-containing protein n=1 Tax=Burkholderia aenigmatica TaxID=2015348 RepID=UPI003C6CA2D9